ncbi:NPCBM/NEW2 domain-containing protein, partial [Patescibacteria group bacterium]
IAAKLPDSNPYLFTFFTSLSIVMFAFFLFQTESHDRYAFPLSIFFLFITPFLPKKHQRYWIIGYIAWSIIYFFNLHSALAEFYPHNAIPILRDMITPPITLTASVLNTTFFFLFMLIMKRYIRWSVIIIPLLFIGSMLLMGNKDYLLGKPIYLSHFTPYKRIQDWGRSVEDKAGNSGVSVKDWKRLSTQYYFFKKGVGTHAYSRLTYDVNGLFTWFTTDYGVDTEAGSQGSVQFQVWGDAKLLYESDVIGRYDIPRHADVDISGVDTLELVVTDSGNGNVDDHADWLNTKLWK